MPIYYRETVHEPHSGAGQQYYQKMATQTHPASSGQQAVYKSGGTQSRLPPQFQQQYSTGTIGGSSDQRITNNSRTEEYSRTESGNWPTNFPKIPAPQGIVDDAQLERMAAELMKEKAALGWESQPGWNRQTQQSYTIETVVSELVPISRGSTSAVEKVPNSGPTFLPPHQQHQTTQQQFREHQKAPQLPPHQFQYSVNKSVIGQQKPRGEQHFQQIGAGQPQTQSKMQQPRVEQPSGQWSQFLPEKQPVIESPPTQQISRQKHPQQYSRMSGQQFQQPMAGKQPQTQLNVQSKKLAAPSTPQSQQSQQINQNYYEEYSWNSDQQPQQNGHSQPKLPNQPEYQQQMKQLETEPQFHQIAKGQPQVQSNKFHQSNQQIRTTKFEEDYGKPKEGQQSQLQLPQSQSITMPLGQQQTSFADENREAHTVPTPHQNVLQAANQQQKGQQQRGRDSQNDEPNTIHYGQKMENTQQKQPSMEIGEKDRPKQQPQQATTIYYEQKREGGNVQKIHEPQQGDGLKPVEENEDDKPPPEMQLAEADPVTLKNEQQQQAYGNRHGGWPPLQQQPYGHKKPLHQYGDKWEQQDGGALYQQRGHPNYQEPLYVSADQQHPPPEWDGHSPRNYYQYQHFQPQRNGAFSQYYSPSSIGWEAVYGDDWALDGQMPPSFTTGPSWGDHLAYAQKVNLERRRAESEQRKRHHSPVPGSAEHGYLFGGMDFVDHQQFDPYANVGEPHTERQSRRDLHWGPPRRRGDFFGLDYTTMPGERPPRPLSAEDAQNYQGYQPLPPRKSFRLCGHITFDPDAPLNIAEAQGLNELDSQYWVGDTLSNQRIMAEHPLTDEEKRTFALLYGPGGFKPDHITVRPEPKPEEPVQFSVTIGPRKEYERKAPPPEGYVNPMKVEGESWILGNRVRDGYYGGHHPTLHATQTGGEHLAFHRPRHFPPHIPQWARQRMEQQGRGEARSLDRSLFAPAWSKVLQPQPPFWVKRDGSKVAGGFEMNGQKLQNETERVKKQEEEQGESFGQKIQQQDRTQPQQAEFKTEQDVPQQKTSQEQFHQSTQQPVTVGQQKFAGGQIPQKRVEQQNVDQMTQQSGQQNEQIKEDSQQQMAPKQTQPSAPQNVQYNQLKQSQQIAYGQGGGGTFSRKMQQIHQQPKMQTNPLHYQKDREQDQATGQNTEGGQWIQFTQPGGIDYVGQNQQQQRASQGQQFHVQQPNYQLIVNPPKIHQGGIVPAKQPLTQRQEQQQQVEQQQKYYEFYEGRPMGQKQQQPSKIKKVEEKRQLGSSADLQQWTQFNQPGGIDYRQGVRPQSSAGNAHNLPSRNTRIVQQSGEVPLNTNEETSGLENLAKIKLGEFPLRQQSLEEQQQASAAAGNGKIFVDAHGRPVQYVKETKLNPSTGQPVTREEWRLVEQQQSGGPSSGNYQLRQPQMNPAQIATTGIQPKADGVGDAQWSQFNKPGGMYYGQQ